METLNYESAGQHCLITTTGDDNKGRASIAVGTRQANAHAHFDTTAGSSATALTFDVSSDLEIADDTTNPYPHAGTMERMYALWEIFNSDSDFLTDVTGTWSSLLDAHATNLTSIRADHEACYDDLSDLDNDIADIRAVLTHVKVPKDVDGNTLGSCTHGLHYTPNTATGIGYFSCRTP